MACTSADLALLIWHKSSYSNGSEGLCLEVATGLPGTVPVRDSKAPDGPALLVNATAWAPFIAAVAAGDLTL
ncbi:DUF397 domain-containing protein [Streptomyces sp. p1417]|uniref:DUF397 domain-containing protein n=1 Tax=Streptomyces typhae TaxID=2681492 RepID=A0A6L6WUM5_9ACTN|nr:DUF397 domain-containing protein [Streptomyces typhae]MVO85880.1 DUF397 domain-containing protein [Streptomyces typhae]